MKTEWIALKLTAPEKHLEIDSADYSYIQTVTDKRTPFCHRSYRQIFELSTVPENAVLNVAARTLYKVYVNGVFLMAGPARSPGQYLFADTLDVASHLRPGQNLVALELLYVGPRTEYDFGAPGFALELKADNRLIAGRGWKEKNWRAYAAKNLASALRNTYPAEYPDAGKLDRDWILPDYDDRKWRAVQPTAAPGSFRPRPMPLPTLRLTPPAIVIDHGDIDRNGAFLTGGKGFAPSDAGWKVTTGKTPRYLVYDFGGTVSGLFEFEAVIPAGLSVACHYCEWLNRENGAPLITATQKLFHGFKIRGDGKQIFYRTFHPFSARYLCVVIPPGAGESVTINSIAMREWCSLPEQERGTLTCSDPILNRTIAAAKQTLRVCAPDLYVDCASHERRIYLCDSYWGIEAGNIFFGDTAISQTFLDVFADCRGHLKTWPGMAVDGVLCCAGGNRKITLGHNLSFILQGLLHQKITGAPLSRSFRESANGIIADVERHVNALGLIEAHPEISWFLDWSKISAKIGIGVGMNALYYMVLDRWSKVAGSKKLAARAASLRSHLRAMAAPFVTSAGRNRFSRLVPDAFELREGELHPVFYPEVISFGSKAQYARSEATQYFLLWSGALEPSEADRLWEVLRDLRINAEPRHDDNRLFALARAGLFGLWPRLAYAFERNEADVIVRDVRDICRPMVEQGNTLWETLCHDTRSNAHGFAAYAGTLLFKCLCGILPGRHGYQDPVIRPLPTDGIGWARGWVNTEQGTIGAAWRHSADEFQLTVNTPPKITARVVLPPCAATLAARAGKPLTRLEWVAQGNRSFKVTAGKGLLT